MSFLSSVKTQKFRMQSIIYFLSCCILTWIECLIFSFVFVVVGMYNLILLTSSICLVNRYEETPVLQNIYGRRLLINLHISMFFEVLPKMLQPAGGVSI